MPPTGRLIPIPSRPMSGSISFVDNNGQTNNPLATLSISSTGADFMRLAFSEAGLANAPWMDYTTQQKLDLTFQGYGAITAWVEFADLAGNIQTTHAHATTILNKSFDNPLTVAPQVDLILPNNGPAIEFTRFYQPRSDYTGPLGRKWSHKYNMFLTFYDSSDIVLCDGDLTNFYFKRQADGSFLPWDFGSNQKLIARYDTLLQLPDTTWQLTALQSRNRYIFDATGKLIKLIDLKGNEIDFTYSTAGLLTEIAASASLFLNLAYNDSGLLSQITDNYGRAVSYGYLGDSLPQLAAVTDVNGKITQYQYSNDNITQITTPDGHSILYHVDVNQLIDSVQRSDGAFSDTLNYTLGGDNYQITDANGKTTTDYYNNSRKITEIVYPDGGTKFINYNSSGLITNATDENGNTVNFGLDAKGNITQVTDPEGNQVNIAYDPVVNKVTKITDAKNNSTVIAYDTQGNPVSLTDRKGNSYNCEYDHNGHMTQQTDPLNNQTSYAYNTDGSLSSIVDALNNQTNFAWTNGNLSSFTDSLQNQWSRTYDNFGNTLTETDPLGNTNTYARNQNGDITTLPTR